MAVGHDGCDPGFEYCATTGECICGSCPTDWTWDPDLCICLPPATGDRECQPAPPWYEYVDAGVFGEFLTVYFNFPQFEAGCCSWQRLPAVWSFVVPDGAGQYTCPEGFVHDHTYTGTATTAADVLIYRTSDPTAVCFSCTTDAPAGSEVPGRPATATPWGPYESWYVTPGTPPHNYDLHTGNSWPMPGYASIGDFGLVYTLQFYGTGAEVFCCPTPTPDCWPDCSHPPECPEGTAWSPGKQMCSCSTCPPGYQWCATSAQCVSAPDPTCKDALRCTWNETACAWVCDDPSHICGAGISFDYDSCSCLSGGPHLLRTAHWRALLFRRDTDGNLKVDRYDPDDLVEETVQIHVGNCHWPHFHEHGAVVMGTFLDGVQPKLATSYLGGKDWTVDSIPGTYQAVTSALHRERLVVLAWDTTRWIVKVGVQATPADPYVWNNGGADVAIAGLTSPSPRGHLRVREDGVLEFVYQDTSNQGHLLQCFALGNDGTGDWV